MSEFKLDSAEIVTFDVKEATPGDWKAFHKFRSIRHNDLRPDDPEFPDDLVEGQMRKDDPFGKSHHWGVMHGGAFISMFNAYEMYPSMPGYESNKHLFSGGGSVLKEFRRKGIGTMWLRKVVDLMSNWDQSVYSANTEEDDGHAFLKWIGAEGKQAAAENRLNFKEVDWKVVDAWIEAGKEKSPDTQLELYEDRIPSDRFDELSGVFTDLANTMPFDDLDHGDLVMTPEFLKEMYERIDMVKGSHHIYLTREGDSTVSGITDVIWIPARPTYVQQNFTGVNPDHRGRGLGKLLKASMLKYLGSKYPEIQWVTTGNANSNDSMLAINKQLGFREYKGSVTYQISRDDLQSFLTETDKGKTPKAVQVP